MKIGMKQDEGRATSPIAFRLDPRSGVPPYLQLVQQVENSLRLGYLKRGDQLPRVKDVVGSLAINPNTVQKAYRELERRGLTAGRPGQGTFVEGTLAPAGMKELLELRRALEEWIDAARATGVDKDGMRALFNFALAGRSSGEEDAHAARDGSVGVA